MIQNPFCELEEHWAKRQAQNHVADQMHYLLFSRASVIQFRTSTYLWSAVRKKLNCEESKVLYSATMPAKIETNKHELKRCHNVLSHCLGNIDWSTSKQMKEVAFSNSERWHPASGFSGRQRACALKAAGMRAPFCMKLILLLSIHGKPFTPLPGLALTEIWVGTTNTKLQ